MFYSLEEALEYYKEHDCHEYDNFEEVFESHDWYDEFIDGVAVCKRCELILSYGNPGMMLFYPPIASGVRDVDRCKCSILRMRKAIGS